MVEANFMVTSRRLQNPRASKVKLVQHQLLFWNTCLILSLFLLPVVFQRVEGSLYLILDKYQINTQGHRFSP